MNKNLYTAEQLIQMGCEVDPTGRIMTKEGGGWRHVYTFVERDEGVDLFKYEVPQPLPSDEVRRIR